MADDSVLDRRLAYFDVNGLAYLMEKLSIDENEVAASLKREVGTVQRWMRGDKRMNYETRIRLGERYGRHILEDEFFKKYDS